jgi:hypothetical protein
MSAAVLVVVIFVTAFMAMFFTFAATCMVLVVRPSW